MASSKVVYIVSQIRPTEVKEILMKALPSVKFQLVNVRNATPGIFYREASLGEEELSELKDAEIIIADNMFMPQIAKHCGNCKWISGTYAGVETVFNRIGQYFEPGQLPKVSATRFSGKCFSKLISDYCLSYLIAVERGFLNYRSLQHTKDWHLMLTKSPSLDRCIDQLTITILGFGPIGKLMCKHFSTLGSKVIAYSRTDKNPDELKKYGVSKFTTKLEDALCDTDHILAILPHTKETAGLLNGKLQACKNKPSFINCGRGSLISSPEIIKALDKGFISWAILDVFEKEPLPTDDPLWTHPQVIITPHVSAKSQPADIAELFVENYHRYISGEPLEMLLDWSKGY